MTQQQRQRLKWVFIAVLVIGGGGIFIFSALKQSMMYFMTPTEIIAKRPTSKVRLGGVVEKGSIKRTAQTVTVNFQVTDFNKTVPVEFTGIAPDLFKESQGVVADGVWENGLFKADKILAKHDENYMPIELSNKIIRQ